MLITLDHLNISSAGRLKGASAILARTSCVQTSTLSADVDALLCGKNPSRRKVHAARALGIPVLDEAHSRALLEHGQIEWDGHQGTESLGELIGEARALLDGEPTRARWDALTLLADRCHGERLPELIAYISPHLERWPLTRPDQPDAAGSLCVAPSHWLLHAMGGHDSPAYDLVRAVSFRDVAIPADLSLRFFARDLFPSAIALDLGGSRPDSDMLTFTFYEKLIASPLAARLRTLVRSYEPWPDKSHQEFDPLHQPGALPALTALHLQDPYLEGLEKFSSLEQLHTLELWGTGGVEALCARPERLVALRHLLLHQDTYGKSTIQELVAQLTQLPELARLESFTLSLPAPGSLYARVRPIPDWAPSLQHLAHDERWSLLG